MPVREFAEKIRAASEHRTDPDFVIIARTDARAVTSLDDAIERGNRYAEAGADLIFVKPRRRWTRSAGGPGSEGAAARQHGKDAPRAHRRARAPRSGSSSSPRCAWRPIPAIERTRSLLKERGTDWHEGPVLAPMDIFRKVGFDWWHAVEEKRRLSHP